MSLRSRRRHVGSATLLGAAVRCRLRPVGRLSQLWTLPNAAAYGPSGAFRSCGRCRTLLSTARRVAAVRLQEITKV